MPHGRQPNIVIFYVQHFFLFFCFCACVRFVVLITHTLKLQCPVLSYSTRFCSTDVSTPVLLYALYAHDLRVTHAPPPPPPRRLPRLCSGHVRTAGLAWWLSFWTGEQMLAPLTTSTGRACTGLATRRPPTLLGRQATYIQYICIYGMTWEYDSGNLSIRSPYLYVFNLIL